MTQGDLQLQVEVNAPIDRLFEAVATASGIARWWTTNCTMDARVGGEARFDFPGAGFHACVEITRLDPGHLVEWRVTDQKHAEDTGWSDLRDWIGTTIRFECESLGDDRSRLRFTHAGLLPLECAGVCSSSWQHYLGDSLRAYLETGRGKPFERAGRK